MNIDIEINEVLYNIFLDFEKGKVSGLEVLTFAKKLEVIAKSLKEHEEILDDAKNYIVENDSPEIDGIQYRITKRNSYSFDFELHKELKEKLKEIETLSKNMLSDGTKKLTISFENEEWDINPAISKESESIYITLPKN